ncbi:hypothetical protein JL100_011730 [Skermanella mucosa]|uniref:hypothetical protein n=1 Tax=Skermanella mucosa TaxID=1789672 RepID=UPI00192B1F36|nr:hypothetical protein [Skermanella mucosa]UEM23365.1 hypothetical protein JL100_011730 [Skermanella mucosa]
MASISENSSRSSLNITASGDTSRRWLAVGISVPAIIVTLALLQNGYTYGELLNDPADIIGYDPFLGMISTLGLFSWAAAAGVAALAATVLRGAGDAQAGRFFGIAGVLTLLLLVDDAFMLHEQVLPKGLGIRERYIKVGYLFLAAAFAMTFFRFLIRNNPILLASSVGFLAGSVVFDNPALLNGLGLMQTDLVLYIVEDGCKFTGIVLWFTWMLKTAADSIGNPAGT